MRRRPSVIGSSVPVRRSRVDTRVRRGFSIPAALGAVMLLVSFYDAGAHHVPFVSLVLWMIGGIAVGVVFGRLTRVKWDSARSMVVLEEGQAVVMVLYIAFRVIAELFIHWTIGPVAYFFDILLLFTASTLIGRSWGIARNVRDRLR
jgi:hypothetical protein